MILIKRMCYISISPDNIADSLIVGGLLGIHGQIKRVSCPQRIYTDLTFPPFIILFSSVPLYDLVHLFDVFSWTSSHYPVRICRIALSCLLYPTVSLLFPYSPLL